MRKVGTAGVGRQASQIELPLEWDVSSDTASAAEAPHGDRPSGAAKPAEEGRPKRQKWYSLYDKVYAPKNLEEAWKRVRSNRGAPGWDRETIQAFEAHAEANLQRLHEELRTKRYRPQPARRKEIEKPDGGLRPLGIPCVRDRIAQQAVVQVLTPIYDPEFSDGSHGFRPQRGPQTAQRAVDLAIWEGGAWVVDADVTKFFDTVDHEMLLDRLSERIADGSVLKLIRLFLKCGVVMEWGEVQPTEIGTPQGGPLSPLLANIYLDPLDKTLDEQGFRMVRYADDFVLFTWTRERAEEALEVVREIFQRLKLHLHPEKTRVAAVEEGFDFLGYHYYRDAKGRLQKAVSRKKRQKFREKIRRLTKRRAGQKRRNPKRCTVHRLKRNQRVQKVVADINEYLRGWHAYYRHARTAGREAYFDRFDRFVRTRLRHLISGRFAQGRWKSILPNELFEEIGLTSLQALQQSWLEQLPSPPRRG